MTNREDIRKFVNWWNGKFALDFWYRNHYNIRFNSPEHRACCLIDMAFELDEFLVAKDAQDSLKNSKEAKRELAETGYWLKQPSVDSKAFKDAFDDLDITKLVKDG